jgi:drug/metabolite transporter (DMT)-like permease
MMRTKKLGLAIILVIICTIFSSAGQLLMKFGVNKLELNLLGLITNFNLILGLIFYVLGAIIMLFAFKQADLSSIYPFFSLSYIWVALLSSLFLGESLIIIQWLGVLSIILGVYFVGRGAEHA